MRATIRPKAIILTKAQINAQLIVGNYNNICSGVETPSETFL